MVVKRKTKNKRLFLGTVGAAALVFFALVLTFGSSDEEVAIPHTNPIDTKISQYSNRNITPNAIITNNKFKDLAFETKKSKSYLFQNQIATAVRSLKNSVFITSNKESGVEEQGTWLWTPVLQMTPEYIDAMLAGAKQNNINTIYVSIDSYLDIFVMPEGTAKEEQKKIFSNKLEYLLSKANKLGIYVDAEAGWKNWAEEGNTYKPLAIVSYVKEFNSTNTIGFRGFQYDVEPYLLERYQNEKASVLKNFVSLVDQTEKFLGESDLRFSVVIPSFYDKKDEMTPKFAYGGNNDYAFGHIMNILERREESSVIIMSYRNFADEKDGSIEISKNEMNTAKKKSYSTKIIIAQETGDVPPPYITFHQTSKSHLLEQIKKINTAFGSYNNFGGIAIHYINSYLSLR